MEQMCVFQRGSPAVWSNRDAYKAAGLNVHLQSEGGQHVVLT